MNDHLSAESLLIPRSFLSHYRYWAFITCQRVHLDRTVLKWVTISIVSGRGLINKLGTCLSETCPLHNIKLIPTLLLMGYFSRTQSYATRSMLRSKSNFVISSEDKDRRRTAPYQSEEGKVNLRRTLPYHKHAYLFLIIKWRIPKTCYEREVEIRHLLPTWFILG